MILVTGAGGFIGQRLCAKLRDLGLPVRGVGRGMPPSGHPATEWCRIDGIGPQTIWDQHLDGVSHVIHLAAKTHDLARPSPDQEKEFMAINVLGTRHLVEAAIASGVRRILFASSVKAQAEATVAGAALTETTPPTPTSLYGATKLAAEQELTALSAKAGVEYVILRFPLIYGPGVKANMLQLMAAVAAGKWLPLGGIDNRRSLLFLDNCCDAIIACLCHRQAANELFLVSDGDSLSTPELIRFIAAAMNRTPRLIPLPVRLLTIAARAFDSAQQLTGSPFPALMPKIERLTGSLVIDSGKLERLLGWRPPYTTAEGIRQMVAWYQGVGERTKF